MGLVTFLPACLLILLGFAHLHFAYELPARSDKQALQWWQEEVVYQVYPRSHLDTDGDGIGDLLGIERKLDHFVDLGVKSVWISPIYKSPMKDFGYDVSDFTDIDPMFGTIEGFRNLSRAMKEKGIKLIMDYVPNHSSDQHEWFQKSINKEGKYTDYYVWKDKKDDGPDGKPVPPNNWLSVFGRSAWEWNDVRKQFYLHQFTKEQPDLNFENQAVVTDMLAVVKFWLDEGVDGFRVDAVPHLFEDQDFEDEPVNPNPPENADCTIDHACLIHNKTYNLPKVFDMLAQYRRLMDIYTLKDGQERVMMVESTVSGLDKLFEYYGTKERPIAHYPFNFEFINRIKAGFTGNDIEDLVAEWFTKMPEGGTANWLLGNHDNSRVASRFGEAFIDPFNMINLLLPGSAVTYYGEEIGMSNANISWADTVDPPACDMGEERYQQFSRDPERTPMQWNGKDKNAGFSTADKTWLPMHRDWLQVNVEDQINSVRPSHIQVYKKIVELRKTDTWRYGSMESQAFDNGTLFGFTRVYNDEGFIFIANFGDENKNVNLADNFKNLPSTANVYLTSVDFMPATAIGTKQRTDGVMVGRKHAMILTWNTNESSTTTDLTTDTTTTEKSSETTTTASASTSFICTTYLFISVLVSAFLKL